VAYNEILAERMRAAVEGVPDLVEKHMFGGIGFLVRGNMAWGVHGDDLIVRVGADAYAKALAHPRTRPFDMTGRSMSGWITVQGPGYAADRALRA